MSLKLRDRDYVPNGAGGFQTVSGSRRVLEEALFLLSVRRGSFSVLPEMGSRLYTLGREKPSVRATIAKIYAQEALTPMGITVTGAKVTESDVLAVEINMEYENETFQVEVAVS